MPTFVSLGNCSKIIVISLIKASIRLFDPQPGATAGMNQALELKIFKFIGYIGTCLGALMAPRGVLNRAGTASQCLCFVVDQVLLTIDKLAIEATVKPANTTKVWRAAAAPEDCRAAVRVSDVEMALTNSPQFGRK